VKHSPRWLSFICNDHKPPVKWISIFYKCLDKLVLRVYACIGWQVWYVLWIWWVVENPHASPRRELILNSFPKDACIPSFVVQLGNPSHPMINNELTNIFLHYFELLHFYFQLYHLSSNRILLRISHIIDN
jgi:hypothetical protein